MSCQTKMVRVLCQTEIAAHPFVFQPTETWGEWFGRIITQMSCDCCLSSGDCCCKSVLTPEEGIIAQIERIETTESDRAVRSEKIRQIVEKVISEDPFRLINDHDLKMLFRPVKDVVLKLNLSNVNLITHNDHISVESCSPCSKVRTITSFFRNLSELNLSRCMIGTNKYHRRLICSENCLKAIATLHHLEKLDLSHNPLDENVLLATIPKLSKLQVLNLTGCFFSDETHKALGALVGQNPMLTIIGIKHFEKDDEKTI